MHPDNGTPTPETTSGGTILRMHLAQQRREVKATQNLSIIVLFFMICWIPLYTINCIIAFCSDCKIPSIYMYPFIILSHANSACNPLLYAYHLKDFRAALKQLIYNIFGIEPSVPFTYNGRPSIASTNAFSNSNYGRYLKDNRYGSSMRKDNSYYIRRYSNNRLQETKFHMRNNTSNISSIVPKSFAVAAATVAAGENNREIWRISELSSTGIDEYDKRETPNNNKDSCGSDQSLNVNSMFLDGSNFDVISDDVFLDDMCPITINKRNDLNSISDNKISETSVIQPSSTSAYIKKKKKNNNNLRDCLSSSSPQLSKNLFLHETDLIPKNRKRKFVRSFSEVLKESRASKRGLKFSLSGDFIQSPNKSIKLSPFKMNDCYLLNKHSEISSDDSSSFKDSSNELSNNNNNNNKSMYKFDNQSFDS